MCKVIKDYGKVAEKGSKSLNLQTITDLNRQKRLALVSYKDGMSVNITDITVEAKKLKQLLEEYLDYKTPEKESEAEVSDIVRSLTTLPALDGNYKSVLEKASVEDIEEAVKLMEKGGNHKTRINTCNAELKRRNGANTKSQKVSDKADTKAEEKKEENTIIPFPTEDKKPNIIPLKTEGDRTYGECYVKLKKETAQYTDPDNEYVIMGLLELLKVDGDFRNNFMREDKSYEGFASYMFDAAMNGYCGRKGNVGWLDKDRALGIAIDYYNNDEEAQKEKAKKEAEKKKAKVASTRGTKKKTRRRRKGA